MYELKMVERIEDGEEKTIVTKFKCPDCKVWGDIDDDQFKGKVSILCDCGFHETIDFGFHRVIIRKGKV